MLWHGKNFRGIINKAKEMIFDNTGTDLVSTNAEDAIKEVNSNLSDLKTYQMTEKIVATFNGHNVYEKSYYASGLSSTDVVVDNDSVFYNDNAYAIVSINGGIKTTGGNIMPPSFYQDASLNIKAQTTSKGLRIIATGYIIGSYFLTVRYIRN